MKLNTLSKPLFKKLKIGNALWRSIKDFLLTTYVHAYHYLVDSDRHLPEKLMWLVLHIVMISTAIGVVMSAWSRFTDNPTITTLESQHHSIYELNFPAIAICPNNKIGRQYAEKYADYLLSLNIPAVYMDKNILLEKIRFMGRMYDSDIEEIEKFLKFQEDALDNFDYDKRTGIYNMREKLKLLSPKCSEIVLKCKWGGEEVKCTDVLKERETNEGFCCTFNYVRPSSINETQAKPIVAAGIGPDMGLTVLLNLSVVDYYYPLKSFAGATALIFDPFEFADSSTGFVREVQLERAVETRITLSALSYYAVDEVQRYSVSKRKCLFSNDYPEYGNNYLYGDCLAKCKLKSVMALCKCIPFNLPTNFPDIDTTMPICNLGQIQCLNKYKAKWGTFKPREFISVLQRDIEDSLSCDTCYPLCTSTVYIVDSTSAQLNFHYINKGSVLAGLSESEELSILKVYFPETDSVLFKTDVLFAWYDIISDYGGILGLFLGCSIITVFEIIFYTTIRFYQNLFNSVSFMKRFQRQKPNVFDNKVFHQARFDYLH